MVFFKRRIAFFFLVFILLTAVVLFSFKFSRPAEPTIGGFKIKLENDQGLNLQLDDSQVLTDFFADRDVENQGFFFYTGSQRVFPETLVFKMTNQYQVWMPVLNKGTDRTVYSFSDQWDEEKKEYQLIIQVSDQTWSGGDELKMLESLEKSLFMTLIYTAKDSIGDKTLNDQDIQFLNSIYLDGRSIFSLNPDISGWIKPVWAMVDLNPDQCTTQNYTCVSGTVECGSPTYDCECSVGGDDDCVHTGEECKNNRDIGLCECDIPYCVGGSLYPTKTCGADGCPPTCDVCQISGTCHRACTDSGGSTEPTPTPEGGGGGGGEPGPTIAMAMVTTSTMLHSARSHARSVTECGFAPLHCVSWRTTNITFSQDTKSNIVELLRPVLVWSRTAVEQAVRL